jgi:hypothetical protein
MSRRRINMRHDWTWEDDLVVLYVYLFSTEELNCTVDDIARWRGIATGSFKMRLKNFAFIDGNPGLSHYGKTSKDIYDKYKDTDEKTLRRLAFQTKQWGHNK